MGPIRYNRCPHKKEAAKVRGGESLYTETDGREDGVKTHKEGLTLAKADRHRLQAGARWPPTEASERERCGKMPGWKNPASPKTVALSTP